MFGAWLWFSLGLVGSWVFVLVWGIGLIGDWLLGLTRGEGHKWARSIMKYYEVL